MGSNNLYESLLSEIKAINSFLVTLFRLNAKKLKDKNHSNHLWKKAYRINDKVDCYNITLRALDKCLSIINWSFLDLERAIYKIDNSKYTFKTPLCEFKNNDLIPLLIDIPEGKDLLYRLRCNAKKNCGLTIFNLCEAKLILNKPLSCILHEIDKNKGIF